MKTFEKLPKGIYIAFANINTYIPERMDILVI
jgi:hypothetical protein